MGMDWRAENTWLGFGIKGGGHLFVVGAETAEIVAGRLDQFTTSLQEMNISSFRFGLGLGAGAGVCLFMAFHTPQLGMLNGTQITPALKDFNVNISVELKVPLGNSFKLLKPIAARVAELSKAAGGIKTGLGALKASDVSTLRDFAHMYYQAVIEGSDAANNTSISKTIVMDIPGLGYGLEVSLYWTQGEIIV